MKKFKKLITFIMMAVAMNTSMMSQELEQAEITRVDLSDSLSLSQNMRKMKLRSFSIEPQISRARENLKMKVDASKEQVSVFSMRQVNGIVEKYTVFEKEVVKLAKVPPKVKNFLKEKRR